MILPERDPEKLSAILLQEATESQQRQFATMLAEEQARADLRAKGHKCWLFVPSPTEWEKMRKFAEPPDYDKCPKCGKGRVVVEIYHGNMGIGLTLKCRWSGHREGKEDYCDFEEYISDDE